VEYGTLCNKTTTLSNGYYARSIRLVLTASERRQGIVALPYYPKLKMALEEWFLEVFEDASRSALGVFNQSPRFRQHEAASHRFDTIDGHEKVMEFQEISAEISLTPSELPGMSLDDILRLLIESGRSFGQKQAEYHFGQIEKITTETGNVVSGPLTHETLLSTLEKLSVTFDDQGNVNMPTIVIHPDMAARLKELAKEGDEDPAVKTRLNEIFARKKEAWLEEQNSRKLVD
jgi:hypothetical protein